MCGITGVLAFKNSSFRVTAEYVTRLRDTMVHRGPDGAGVWVNAAGNAGLGHRRLSIIDLSAAAAQPMANDDESLWITYNGELYNHAELRRELTSLGVRRWKTDHSDTEVIVRAFEQWGIACLRRFRGMFAFAIRDERRRELWLVRDRIGIKPLYYSVHHGRLTFASEIKALLADPDQERSVNEEALFHYLSFLASPAPSTLFKGILKVEAGTFVRVRDNGDISRERYWDLWDHTVPLTGVSEDEVAERVIEELRTAVRIHKVSDVPVGIALSGGIDSTVNTALFSENERGAVNTFTVGYDADYPSAENELADARNAAALFRTTHHDQRLSVDDLRSFLPRLVYLQDEPIGDPVCVPVYYLAKQVRDRGVIVCQFGEGADELFCGYHTWDLRVRLQELDDLPVPAFLKRAGLGLMSAAGRRGDFSYEYLRRGATNQPIFWSGAESFTHDVKRRLLSERLRRQFATLTSFDAIAATHQRFLDKAWEQTPLAWMTYADLHLRLPELLLMRVDKMGMGWSVEGRVPFLDHKFVELAMSIPTAMKTRNRELKYILKKAVRGVIPDEIIDRKKRGFSVPVNEWLAQQLGNEARDEVKRFCDASDLLDWKQVEPIMRNPKWRGPSWILLNLALWWRHSIRGDQSDPSGAAWATRGPGAAVA
jgi:asparagine synthase (glutamine-hydrolysing)